MDLIVTGPRTAHWGHRELRCVTGRGGISVRKREGDGATPAGRFAFRRVFFRPDRMAAPATVLPISPIAETSGWCDDPRDAAYNRLVTLPYAAHHERLWRDDGLYDVLVVVGYNDNPVLPGAGSAIFVHVAPPDFGATEGCVAFARDDLLEVLAGAGADTCLEITAPR
jgi:L,D-peptidoglycan transpeptidase YkuD (ErfK/YbiS/YcfS/YnhG family)